MQKLAAMLLDGLRWSPDISFGSILTGVATIGVFLIVRAVEYGSITRQIKDLNEWKHDHERDTEDRDKLLTDVRIISTRLTGLQEDSSRRLLLLEEWVKGHNEWAGEKAELLARLGQIADGQERRIKMLEDRKHQQH